MRHTFILILTFFIASNLFGQKKKIKFGNISKEEVAMESCSFDLEAGAVVLADIGNLWFDVNSRGHLDLVIERHVRIKIFNSNEYGQANIKLPYYTGSQKDARLSSIRAHTITFNGKDQDEIKVDKSDIFEEQINDFYTAKKFTFPKINDGVIIEYKYQLTTSYFSAMKIWEFQQDIPVLYTFYESRIPEYIDCSVNVVGHNSTAIKYNHTTQNEPEFFSNVYSFEGANLPAMQSEPYGTNIRNYTTKARFVTRSYNIPGQFVEAVAGDYADLNKTIVDNDIYNSLHLKNNFLDDELATIQRSENIANDLRNIVSHVNEHSVFNDYLSFYPNNSVRETSNGSPANSGAINMYLTCLLKKAGYQSEALILGTRNYRRPHPFNPDFNDFNHLISHVTLDNGKVHLLDATSDVKGGSPETMVFNAEGWILSKDGGRKVNLIGMGQGKMIINSSWSLEPGTMTNADLKIKANYLGIHLMTNGESYDGEKYDDWLGDAVDLKVTDFSAEDANGLTSMSFAYELDEMPDKDVIYFSPDYYGLIDFEIFKQEERFTPLDIPYKINSTNVIELSIPEGYILESSPSPKKYSMDDNAMKFTYVVTSAENKVNINLRFKVDETFYLPEAYADVRAFMNELESTISEKFVFKKAE